jgi:putative acetyltransferase
MIIRQDDLTGPEIRMLLEEHLRNMQEITPRESVHALDLAALRIPEITVWTAWAGDDLLGCGALREHGPEDGEVKSMRTANAHRGKGVARAILAHILAEARARGYLRVSLETGALAAFEPARRLYESCGFQYCGPFGSYQADPNSVFMTLPLESPLASESFR